MTKVQGSVQRGYDSSNDNGLTLTLDFNMTTCFDSSVKSDDEIVTSSNYRFNLPIEELINNSKNTRLARRNKKKEKQGIKEEIPRRQNAWIIYLRDKSCEFEGFQPGLISKMWNSESKETIELFEALARMSVKIHKKKYGDDYVYKPGPLKSSKKSKNIKKVQKKRKSKETPSSVPESKMNSSQQFFPTPEISPTTPSTEKHSVNSEQQFFPTPVTSSSESIDGEQFVSLNPYPPLPSNQFFPEELSPNIAEIAITGEYIQEFRERPIYEESTFGLTIDAFPSANPPSGHQFLYSPVTSSSDSTSIHSYSPVKNSFELAEHPTSITVIPLLELTGYPAPIDWELYEIEGFFNHNLTDIGEPDNSDYISHY